MIPELLAPAGSAPAFEAALNAGADAVYLGVPAFNARALARDFRLSEIPALIDFARGRGKRVYPAMNSLVKEEELGQALETLAFLAKAKPDGIILQDWGLLRLARRHFPDVPLHASTLMTAHNSVMVRHLAELGCRRVVLARELSLVEIRRIESQTRSLGVELELFVHGAMCFCYSGLCRFSSLHGGKSSLRGQCVQPCRRRWQWLDAGKPVKADKGKEEKESKKEEKKIEADAVVLSLGYRPDQSLKAALEEKAKALDEFIEAQENLENQQKVFTDRISVMFEENLES